MSAINKINKLSQSDFVKVLANIFENAIWIAKELYKQKPFNSFEDLSLKMLDIFENTTKENLLNFSKIGKLFGHMFQIKDDYLGIWGDHNLGKPVGSDIIKKKKSLPILKLIETSDKKDNKHIKEIFNSENINDKSKDVILNYMDKYNIKKFCDAKLIYIYKECSKTIKDLDIDTIHKNIFKKINYFLMYRVK